jgi:hypothetical protein
MSDGYGASLLENPQIVKGILNYNAISVCWSSRNGHES